MSDDKSSSPGQSGPNQPSTEKNSTTSVTHGESATQIMSNLKKRRTMLRGKITRSINRVRKFIQQGAEMRKRIEKEIDQVRKDFELARECHAELYEYVEESQTSTMDDWEDTLTNDLYDIEEKVDDFLQSLSVSEHANTMSKSKEQIIETVNIDNISQDKATGGNVEASQEMHDESSLQETSTSNQESVTSEVKSSTNSKGERNECIANNSVTDKQNSPSGVFPKKSKTNYDLSSPQSFDSWIDNLVEFKETVLPTNAAQMSIGEALYKLEASKDIPTVKLIKYDGNSLSYLEFIERFKLHIHNKPHLSDDMRMVELKMHLIGNAKRAVGGLGLQGTMYAMALKTLKEQFGQPSVIARACINTLVVQRKLPSNDRQALQELSFDVVNCLATLKQSNHLADINATDNLRRIVKRLPNRLIDAWKIVATDLREKGETPSLEHISRFLRKRVKAEFEPDFGDIQKSESRRSVDERKGIHSTQKETKGALKCYVCSEDHRVIECPVFANCSNDEKIQHVKDQRLCFSCLNRGHVTRDCKSKAKCGVNECTRFHHRLLHVHPPGTPRISSATSVLDKDGIMPVVRVHFRSENGRIREGNVLVDSGAGTTVVRKSFAKVLGLQGKRERIDIEVVGGERIQQNDSRRVKFWISPLNSNESYPVEANKIDYTIINVLALDRTWLQSFNHLSDIEFPHHAGPIDLILGVQYSHLHAENEVGQGLPFQPVGKRTKLGWHVIGPDNAKDSTFRYMNFAQKINLEKFYDFETLGVRAPDCSCPDETLSRDGKKAMEHRLGAKRWSNRDGAKHRLKSLERGLAKNPKKANMYDEAIQEYERNGWARKLTDDEAMKVNSPIYYLPPSRHIPPREEKYPLESCV